MMSPLSIFSLDYLLLYLASRVPMDITRLFIISSVRSVFRKEIPSNLYLSSLRVEMRKGTNLGSFVAYSKFVTKLL